MLTLRGFWEGTNKPAAGSEVHLSTGNGGAGHSPAHLTKYETRGLLKRPP